MPASIILVTGATGVQGGATIRSLLEQKAHVRALVRSGSSPSAQALQKLGAEIAVGDFDDPASLALAMKDVSAVYMNVSPSFTDPEAETRHAKNIITAATQPGSSVKTLVHSTTILTGQHDTFPGWDIWNDFARQYWLSKAVNEDSVRKSGVPNWTILRPCFFMSNYLKPLAPFFFPELLSEKVFRTALTPDTPTMLISPDDIGRIAAAALTQPERFGGHEIDLGSEALTPPEVAAALSKASGHKVTAEYIPRDEVEKLIPENHTISAQTFFNEWSSKLDTSVLKNTWGFKLATFTEFLESRKDDVTDSFGPQ